MNKNNICHPKLQQGMVADLKDGAICGGIVNRSNNNAPKTIKSETLLSFSTHFFLYGDFGREFDSFYAISVVKTDTGKMILSESGHKITCETNTEYLNGIQALIKKHNLASINGMDKHTGGLPAEFQPCYFCAEYDSGEKLYFSIDNNPNSPWGSDILELTKEEFSRNGITALNPPPEMEKITRFILSYTKGNMRYNFSEIEVPLEGVKKSLAELAEDGYGENEFKTEIRYQIWDRTSAEPAKHFSGVPTDDYYKGLSELIIELRLKNYASPNMAPNSFNYKDTKAYYEFYIEFEYGNTLCGFSDAEEYVEKFIPIAEKITGYIRQYV